VQIHGSSPSSEPTARAFYKAALAAGHEVSWRRRGCPYEAGNRGASWLKIKRAHTLDLVVLAAEWGHGRRTARFQICISVPWKRPRANT